MTTARKVIDWHGQDNQDLTREFRELPAGRYIVMPAADAGDDEAYEDLELTPEQVAGLDAALERFKRGERGIPASDARAMLQGHIRAVAARRP